MVQLILKNFAANDLYSLNGLQKIDNFFVKQNLELITKIRQGEQHHMLELAPILAEFIADQFFIIDQCSLLQAELTSHNPIIAFKKLFVQKLAKRQTLDNIPSWHELEAWRQQVVPQIKDQEWATANFAIQITDIEQQQKMVFWCARALAIKPDLTKNWIAFNLPQITNFQQLVPDNMNAFNKHFSSRQLQAETNHCIICHPKSGDFCKTGFPDKKGSNKLKTNPLQQKLIGCPLEQHISEMNLMLQLGQPIAALAIAMINNPMIAATGNRICQDCISACVYQKQTPVDIPNIESAMLDMVLNLPWGIEIYHLLTRWNPLRTKQWLPKPFNGHKVAIIGMGPAGFTMAHHLLMEGCAIVGLDGQAMTKMPSSWLQPIYNYQDIKQELDKRSSKGFGGVAEYGITARWDKNLLSIIRLNLARRPYFQCFSSIRFGGNWQLPDAWQQGFSHVVLAVGAGLPNVPNIPGSLAPGMRTGNDFLMALHLGENYINIKLPAVVIGAGLTAVDTATELQNHYLRLITAVLNLYEEQPAVFKQEFADSSKEDIQQWLEHGLELKAEKQQAILADRPINTIKLLHSWGGVTIAYRKTIQMAPAYRENHRELAKAINEGVLFLEQAKPVSIILDNTGNIAGIKLNVNSEIKTLNAKTIWSAIGTTLNVAYSFEHKEHIAKDSTFSYKAFKWNIDTGLTPDKIEHCKAGKDTDLPIFTSVKVNAGVSFIGDTNPAFNGSVVKAMASAKRGYPAIIARLNTIQPDSTPYQRFAKQIQNDFTNAINKIELDESGTWLEFTAPLIAKHWQSGMFCRLIIKQPVMLIPIAAKNNILTCFWPGELPIPDLLNSAIELMGPNGVRYNTKEKDLSRLWFADHNSLPFVLSLLPKIDTSKLTLILTQDVIFDEKLDNLLTDINFHMLEDNLIAQLSKITEEIKELSIFAEPNLAIKIKQITDNKPKWLAKDANLIGQVFGPMQCALKGVCANCLQWQVDAQGKRTKAVYSCSWQHQPLELIDLDHAKARQAVKNLACKE